MTMRTIKFRGKCSHCDAWAYGNLVDYGEDELPEIQGFDVYHEGNDVWQEPTVERDTIGQFTGLYDKNGNEIYEGDILRFTAKDEWEKENFVSYEVFWHDNDCAVNHIGWQMNRLHFQGSLCGADIGIITFLPKWTSKMEVIGNIHDIHDNPKLLENDTN